MDIADVYLVLAVLAALGTLNAYRPLSRSGFLSVPVQVSGMLTSELPLQTLAFQVAVTAALAWLGALDSLVGLVGLLLSVTSWAGLVGLHREAQRARAALGDALRDTTGPADDPPLTTAQQLRLTRGARKRYCTTRDVPYGDDLRYQSLDIWRAPDGLSAGRAPVLVQFHGGAWVTGKKDDQAGPLLTHMVERGWVCVAADYRLSPSATWPDHIVDSKRAIAWVRERIAGHGGDPSFICVTGGSAGGHLAALAALSERDPAFQPGFEDADTTVQAAVTMYGLYDLTNRSGGTRPDTIRFLEKKVFKSRMTEDTARWEAASPICRAGRNHPPFMVVHGANDSFLPVEQARAFVSALRASPATAPLVYAELPRTQHAFDFFTSVRVQHTVRAVGRFLDHVHATRAHAPDPRS